VVVSRNASAKSREWGRDYARRVSAATGDPVRHPEDGGLLPGGYNGRGDFNLRLTAMPAILGEPLFVSDPHQARFARSIEGVEALAGALAASIRENFPEGGLVALSVGHKGKTSSPFDRGADVAGGGTEAGLAEEVLVHAKSELELTPLPADGPWVVLPEGSRRLEMARLIVGLEERTDDRGRLVVYRLPTGDGGGGEEVAGINDKFHPDAFRALAGMVRRGEDEAARAYAAEVIAGYTDVVDRWLGENGHEPDHYPDAELFLRDCIFNRGPVGAAKILQLAVGVIADGRVGPKTVAALDLALREGPDALIDRLRVARERYELQVKGRRTNLWEGLVSRWDKAAELSKSLT